MNSNKLPNPTCPNCGSSHVIPILYGYPSELGDETKYKIGGCMLREDNPEWYCKDCESEWQTNHADLKDPKKVQVIVFESGPVLEDQHRCYKIDLISQKLSQGHAFLNRFWKDLDKNNRLENELSLTKKDWQDFTDQLEKLDILNWKNQYDWQPQSPQHVIVDGSSWSMAIKLKGITIKKQGYNAYPPNWEEWIKLLESFGCKDFSASEIQQIIQDLKDPTKKMFTITMTNTTPRKWKPRQYKPWKQEEQTAVVKPDREIINHMIPRDGFPHCPICGSRRVKQILYHPYSEEVNRKYYYLSRKEKEKDSYDWKCYFCGYRWYYDCNGSLYFKDIQKIHFEAGSCFGFSRVHYLIDFTEHSICWDDAGFLSFDPDHVYPYGKWLTGHEWDQLYQTLEKMRILLWMGFYDRICALDGFNWSMNIMTKDALIQKYGSNDQPKFLFTLIKILEEHTFQEINYPNFKNKE